MTFAAHFPYLVRSIILLAPAGLLRRMPDEYESVFFRYSSLVPSWYLRRLVGKILGLNLVRGAQKEQLGDTGSGVRDTNGSTEAPTVSDQKDTDLDIPAIVQWQFDHHQGFVHSFVDNIKHGPILDHRADYDKACAIITGKTSPASIASGSGAMPLSQSIYNSKILVVFGDSDSVVVADQVSKDLEELLGGKDHVEFRTVPGGHGFPVPSCEDVVRHIVAFWGLN